MLSMTRVEDAGRPEWKREVVRCFRGIGSNICRVAVFAAVVVVICNIVVIIAIYFFFAAAGIIVIDDKTAAHRHRRLHLGPAALARARLVTPTACSAKCTAAQHFAGSTTRDTLFFGFGASITIVIIGIGTGSLRAIILGIAFRCCRCRRHVRFAMPREHGAEQGRIVVVGICFRRIAEHHLIG